MSNPSEGHGQILAPGLTFAPGATYWNPKASRGNPAPSTTPTATAVLAPAPPPMPQSANAAGSFTPTVYSPTRTPANTITQPTARDDPILSSLAELQESPASDERYNPGVRSNRRSNPPPALPTASPTPDGLPWVTGQSTGYATLALMHPRARAMAEAQITTLARARVREPFLAILADGTFEFDAEIVERAAQQLSADGRNFSLLMYLSSGPTMRRSSTTPISAAFARLDPESFREGLQFDASIRFRYTQIATRALALAKFVRALKPQNKVLIVPSLEDNLDRESYRAIRTITASVFGNDATIVRNVCPGCWDGNDTDSLGDPIEVHVEELLARIGPRDVFTLDGLGHRYVEEQDPSQLSEDRVRELKALAIQRDVGYFGLWRKQRQGLGNQLIHPDERTYEVPTTSQIAADIALLRYGLELE